MRREREGFGGCWNLVDVGRPEYGLAGAVFTRHAAVARHRVAADAAVLRSQRKEIRYRASKRW